MQLRSSLYTLSRRRLLTLALLPILLIAGGFALGGSLPRRILSALKKRIADDLLLARAEEIVREKLVGLTLEPIGLQRFCADLRSRAMQDSAIWQMHCPVGGQPEDAIATLYLLSSDYFLAGRAPNTPVRYFALYDPYSLSWRSAFGTS